MVVRSRDPRRALALSACGLLFAFASCRREPPTRPNVLLVTLDTTRADYLGCYGRPGNPTPCLDAIAAEGTRFDLAIATASLTPVSHASILTGLDNAGHGLRVLAAGAGAELPRHLPTLSTILQERGYATAAALSAFPVSSAYGFDRGFDVFDCPEGALETGPAGNPTWNLSALQRRADATTSRAVEWMSSTEGPFFLWVHYFDPHDAAVLPPRDEIAAGVAIPPPGTVDLTPDLYAAEVSYMDAQIARLVAAMKERGTWDDTLVAVVADHGEGLGDHGWQHHRILYQEQIRVPFLLRPSARDRGASRGRTVHSLVRTTDILPTVLDYLGIEAEGRIDGSSLRGLVEGRDEPPRRALADAINGYDWNALGIRERPLDDFLYCAMSARWKLVYRPARPEASELFDLESDPGERVNKLREHPEEALSLQEFLAEKRPWVTDAFPPIDPSRSERASRALASLGYSGGGEVARVEWAWACPRHREDRHGAPTACSVCGSLPVLVRGPP